MSYDVILMLFSFLFSLEFYVFFSPFGTITLFINNEREFDHVLRVANMCETGSCIVQRMIVGFTRIIYVTKNNLLLIWNNRVVVKSYNIFLVTVYDDCYT